MVRHVIRRLAELIVVLWATSLVVFLIMNALPGDPASAVLVGQGATPEQLQDLRVQLGLDRPMPERYWMFLTDLFHGDLGFSFLTNQSVSSLIMNRLPSTLQLTVATLIAGTLIGMAVGGYAALSRGSRVAKALSGVLFVWGTVPYFWLGQLLILVFAVQLTWLPAVGQGSVTTLILPAAAQAGLIALAVARLFRSSVEQVYAEDYVVAAQSRGYSPARIMMRHVLRNALVPLLTLEALLFGALLTGAVAIEMLFGRNGLGADLATAISSKDIPVVQGIVLVIAFVYVMANLIVDILMPVVDPRLRAR
ncbi:ABC transporter permease [Nocardioides sp.]|uniref:ABC transporter permease n=1 Tax=Nocardioides sp. TaxID=35761 RepID=UPI0039E3109A